MLLAAALVLRARPRIPHRHALPLPRVRERIADRRLRTSQSSVRQPAARGRRRRRRMTAAARLVDGRIIRREIVDETPARALRPRLRRRHRRAPPPHSSLLSRETRARLRSEPGRRAQRPDAAGQQRRRGRGSRPAYATSTLDDRGARRPARRSSSIASRRNVAPPDGALVFDREQDGFEDVNAYFHIDRNQRYLQSLGYTGARAVVAVRDRSRRARARTAPTTRSSFPAPPRRARARSSSARAAPTTRKTRTCSCTNTGTRFMEWIAPGTFGGTFASEARALSEGFGDYWAFSAHYARARRVGPRSVLLRRLGRALLAGRGVRELRLPPGTRLPAPPRQHEDDGRLRAQRRPRASSIATARSGRPRCARSHEQLGRTITDTIVVESLFGAPPRPTFAVMAAAAARSRSAALSAACTRARSAAR